MTRTTMAVLTVLLTGCAATYRMPTTSAPEISEHVNAADDAVMAATKRVLVSEGFQIASSDDKAGTISTALRTMRVTPEQADCGKTMGLDYLKDNRVTTRVGIGVIVNKGTVTIKSDVEGDWRVSGGFMAGVSNRGLTCVSRGTIERALLAKVKSSI